MQVLSEEFTEYKIKTKIIGMCPLKMAALIQPQVKAVLFLLNQEIIADNSVSQKLLDIKYDRNLNDSIRDTGYSLIQLGVVANKLQRARTTKVLISFLSASTQTK